MKRRNTTRNALLTSIISLLLCVSMLVGTTFAWFTDSVVSGTNQIIAGNLDVELYHGKGDPTDDVKAATKLFTDEKGNEILWEPGVVAYTNLKVVNEGTLALKYALSINFENENWIEGTNAKLSQVLKIAVVEGGFENGLTREQVLDKVENDQDADWKHLSAWAVNDYLLKQGNYHTYGVVIWWEPSDLDNNWNVQNGKTTSDGKPLHIDLGVKLIATQKDAESDSFGPDYDKTASVTVTTEAEEGKYTDLAEAINAVEDGGIVFVEPGTYTIGSVITISGRNISIIGLGDVTLQYKATGGSHFFNVTSGSNVTFENLTMLNAAKHGVYVRYNSVVTMKDVVIEGSRGSADIMVDEASDVINGYITESTASYVWLYNCDIDRVALCAAPTQDGHIDTFVYFNYDAASTIGSIEKQNINLKPENIYINGVNVEGNGMNLYVTNDAELAAALETIKNDSKYHDVQVYVHLAAGEYSADHVINQYPEWNGIVGRNNGNNYQGGVPAGAPHTVITFVGETIDTYSLRGAQTVPAVTFTGRVVVNGFGDAQAGLGSAVARTTFENVAFANSTKANADGNIAAAEMTAAAANVTFTGCTFENADFVIVGARAYNIVGDMTFDGCTFSDVCISGYVDKTITVKNSVATSAPDGFINNQNNGDIVVDNCTINAGRYFVRTNGSNIDIEVTNSDITVYESQGTKHLVWFRGSNETAEFVDCTIADGYTYAGVDADSTLEIINFFEDEAGAVLYTEAVSGEVVLYNVNAVTAAEYTIPDNVTTLRSGLFTYNTAIKTVNVPASVTDFGGVAQENGMGASGSPFKNSSVETIVLADGITELTPSAIEQAVNLKSITIPASVTKIGIEALAGTGLTELTIPATVTEIGYGAFRDNKSLTTVTIEGDVHIPSYTFRSCVALETVYIKGTNVTFEKGMIFTCYDTGDGRGIEIHVPNEEIKARLLAADSAATTYGGYTIVCEQTPDENGVYTDANDNTYAYASDSTALNTAISGGAETVYLSNSNYKLPSVAGKTVTLVGAGPETVVDYSHMGNYQEVSGSSFVFKNMTVVNAETGYPYPGLQHVKSVSYENCHITGTVNLFAPATFTNCTFDSKSAEHNVVTYGSDSVTFTDCKFTYGDRAVNCYAEDASSRDVVVTFTDCAFTKVAGKDTTGAIETNSSLMNSLTVTINNCTVNEGKLWFVADPWDSLKGAKTFVTVDGKVQVATAEQLAAVVAKGATNITLMDGEYDMPNFGEGKVNGVTFTGASRDGVVIKLYNTSSGGDFCLAGSTATLENMTIITEIKDWAGFQNAQNLTFNKCNFVNNLFLTGNATFNECHFEVETNHYNVWIYTDLDGEYTVEFNKCTFDTTGKSIYVDGNVGKLITVKVNECIFNDDDTCATDKAAIETGKNYGWKYEIIITDSTFNGFAVNPTGLNTGSTVWANKASLTTDQLNVVINGKEVY